MREVQRILIFFVLLLAGLYLAQQPTGAYLDSADFYTSGNNVTNSIIYPWDIITIKVYNPSANTDPNTTEQYQINVNSTSDPAGITLTITETGVNTSIFTAEFQAAEIQSSNTTSATYPYPRLNATDGDTITAYIDLDNDGNYTIISMTFDDADEVFVFSNSNPAGVDQNAKPEISHRYFSDDSTVYVTIFAKAGWPNPNATVYVNSTNNITIYLTEDPNYPGKYTGSFLIDQDQITNNTHINGTDGDRINIVSDIGNDLEYVDSFVIVDNTPPVFSSITPANGSFFSGSTQRTISVTINEAYPAFSNVILHYWRLNGTEDTNGNNQIDLGEKKSTTMFFYYGSTFTATIDDSIVPTNGSVYVWVTGTDQAGNPLVGGGSWNAPILTYKIDNTPPQLSFGNQENESASSGFNLRLNIGGTYSNVSRITYTLSRGNTTLGSGNISCSSVICNISTVINTIDLPLGPINITVNVEDIAGNSVNRTLLINSTPGIRLDNLPAVIGSQSVPNDGTHSVQIEFNVTLKGSYLKLKLSDFSSSTTVFDIDNACDGTCATLQYVSSSGTTTVNVTSDYSTTGATIDIIDQGSMNYAKDVTMHLYIKVPEALPPGMYNGTYAIQAYG